MLAMRLALARLVDVSLMYLIQNESFYGTFMAEWMPALVWNCINDNIYFRDLGWLEKVEGAVGSGGGSGGGSGRKGGGVKGAEVKKEVEEKVEVKRVDENPVVNEDGTAETVRRCGGRRVCGEDRDIVAAGAAGAADPADAFTGAAPLELVATANSDDADTENKIELTRNAAASCANAPTRAAAANEKCDDITSGSGTKDDKIRLVLRTP
ncbi:hypothetical protein B0T17DRAFT_616900 [Bombardia bombarda]|uniref:Uncharacterized protein n=1 Tax=Bombardia bombarda TaxID=252184 RepID=A0AA40C450_9PEZI|nr:hypothetical protein B0T17DRAFT_616900 [Bombardia bombarda]